MATNQAVHTTCGNCKTPANAYMEKWVPTTISRIDYRTGKPVTWIEWVWDCMTCDTLNMTDRYPF